MNIGPISNRFSFFDNPFKDNVPLTHKVTIIAFHVLTLGFPLVVYTAIDCCFPGNSILSHLLPFEPVNFESALDKLKKSRNIAPYSQLEQEALDFAQEKLVEHADVKTIAHFSAEKPVNSNILKLVTIYEEIYWKKFEAALQVNHNDPWTHEEVMDAFENVLKLNYAISILTLEDLPAFAAKSNEPLAKALTRQSGYLSITIYNCGAMYRTGRGGVQWGGNTRYGKGVQYPAGSIPAAHAAPFYQEGTRQNKWRELYNAYSDRIRMYVPVKELNQERPDGDVRVTRMTVKDISPETYKMFGE